MLQSHRLGPLQRGARQDSKLSEDEASEALNMGSNVERLSPAKRLYQGRVLQSHITSSTFHNANGVHDGYDRYAFCEIYSELL